MDHEKWKYIIKLTLQMNIVIVYEVIKIEMSN